MKKKSHILAKTALLGCLVLFISASLASADESAFELENGMQVVLQENHSSPMVSSIIFVKSGSKYESEYENGMTHFLEHLLFDGTANLTRDELDNSIDDLGGYINAFTRKDLTAYLVVLPKQYIDYGIAVQADMLFNSAFPEDELAKERMVVVEEINQCKDSPGDAADAFFTEKAYANTDYARPVLGYTPLIENIPREAIVAYWKEYYTPDRMTMLVIGDFDSPEMKKSIGSIFTSFKASDAGESSKETGMLMDRAKLAEGKRRHGSIIGQNRFDTVANVQSTYVNFSIPAPQVSDNDYLPFDLLTTYLSMEDLSPLKQALLGGEAPLATEVGISLDPRGEFSRLELSIITDNPDNRDSIIAVTIGQLKAASSLEADSAVIAGIKTSVRCEAFYNAEKLHYYGFLIAPLVMSAGWDFIQNYPDLFAEVEWSQCTDAASRWLGNPDYVVTTVRPADTTEVVYTPEEPTVEAVTAYFDSTTFPAHELVEGHHMTFPDVDSVSFELTDNSAYHREVFQNGLTLIVKSNPDSRVFGMNVLGKNRTANEPEGLAGITDFVNRCLEKGTTTRDAARISTDLAAIGANLTVHDNPWIPFDDRYTTRRFSFLKFETIEDFAPTGFALFADILLNPAFDSAEIESVRRSMLGIHRRNAGSPTKTARRQFYETYFEGHAFSGSVMGTTESIGAVTVGDLREHHARFYSPENMILAVVTSRDTAEVAVWAREQFAGLERSGNTVASVAKPAPVFAQKTVHSEMESAQVGIYAGGRAPGAGDIEAADVSIAASILSSRLYLNLREKQGLAYSTGVGTRFDRTFGWYYLVISTGVDNYDKAFDGLLLQTEKLAFDGPTVAEVIRAKNQLWGRLMRAKLSRANQAYYLTENEFLGRPLDYDRLLLEHLNYVDVRLIRKVASKYFRPETWVVSSAGGK